MHWCIEPWSNRDYDKSLYSQYESTFRYYSTSPTRVGPRITYDDFESKSSGKADTIAKVSNEKENFVRHAIPDIEEKFSIFKINLRSFRMKFDVQALPKSKPTEKVLEEKALAQLVRLYMVPSIFLVETVDLIIQENK